MPTVIVDGQEIEVGPEERLNGIEVARRAGVEIPHYCWHAGLSVVASCRMCLVETGRRDPESGEVNMVPKLVPACQTPATNNTVFVTNSDQVVHARQLVEEDLLLRHPVDCPICDKAGECLLQDYHFKYGRPERRADIKPFHSRRRDLGETVTLFVDRCVMCSRCVRFCREVSGSAELMVTQRGAHEEIDVFPGFPLDNKMSGNVVDLCPVGALGDRDFLYQQRVWFMKGYAHVCAGCSTGCSIHIEQNQDRVYRLKPRENPHVNQWWMCDEGRYGWKYIHAPERLSQPQRRNAVGELEFIDWSELIEQLQRQLERAKRPVLVLSPFLTVEEAYLAARCFLDRQSDAKLLMGPIPAEGADESFASGFTIRAEKCPNRQGVAMVLSELVGEITSWDDFRQGHDVSQHDLVWFCGGYPAVPDRVSDDLPSDAVVVVSEMFKSTLTEHADVVLPSAAFAERDGSFVNAQHRLQSFDWAIRPPAGVRSEGALFWRLTGRGGLYRAKIVLAEIAEAFSSFAAAVDVPPQGVDLSAQTPAEQPQ